MKTLGMIGGLSWHSTAEYYRLINEEIHKRLGGLNAGRLLLHSFNFQEIVDWQDQGRWDHIESEVIRAGSALIQLGAEGIIFCANTTHRFADAFEKVATKPLIHIADATAQQILKEDLGKVALLGTKTTMQLDFYKERLKRWKVEALVPDEASVDTVHAIIFDELCQGKIVDSSREILKRMVRDLISKGAEGVILGCTEFTLILEPKDFSVPVFDTAQIHALAAVDFMLY